VSQYKGSSFKESARPTIMLLSRPFTLPAMIITERSLARVKGMSASACQKGWKFEFITHGEGGKTSIIWEASSGMIWVKWHLPTPIPNKAAAVALVVDQICILT